MKPPKINLWNRGTPRRPNYWVRYNVNGEEIREPTGAKTRKEAEAFAEVIARAFATGRWEHPKQRQSRDADTFEVYARKVLAKRVARGIKTAAKDERGHVENHLVPMFSGLRLDELGFKLIRDRFRQLEERGHAGRTIRNIHTTLRAILLEAAEDELITVVPPPLTARRGHLPPPVDKTPGWRETAVFTREEVATLLRTESIEWQYRVMYAAWLLTGSRFSELLPVRLRDYDRAKKPLASLLIPSAKTRRDKGQLWRLVPVHPELRPWLDWWIAEGYVVTHGRELAADDYLFPALGKIRRNRGEALCSHGEIYKRWQRYHLKDAGLRHRRLHDARRTFLSVARSAGAERDLVRAVTHKVTADKVLDAYTTWEWDALCRELCKVQWRIPGPPGAVGEVVKLDVRRM